VLVLGREGGGKAEREREREECNTGLEVMRGLLALVPSPVPRQAACRRRKSRQGNLLIKGHKK